MLACLAVMVGENSHAMPSVGLKGVCSSLRKSSGSHLGLGDYDSFHKNLYQKNWRCGEHAYMWASTSVMKRCYWLHYEKYRSFSELDPY